MPPRILDPDKLRDGDPLRAWPAAMGARER